MFFFHKYTTLNELGQIFNCLTVALSPSKRTVYRGII